MSKNNKSKQDRQVCPSQQPGISSAMAKTGLRASKSKAALAAAAFAVATFLLLPVFFSDQPSNIFLADNDGTEGSLPVIVSQNPFSKYFKKAADFYGLGAKNKNAFGRARGILPPPPDQDYTDEERAAVFAASARARISGAQQMQSAAQPGADALTVQPDAAGYYYDGQYYKNNTYPAGSAPGMKKSIENSISVFHEAQAQKQGKHAAYLLQDDGSLLVKYLPQKEFDALRRAAAGGKDYSGMMVASKKASGAKGSSSYERSGGMGGKSGFTSEEGVFGDVASAYNAASGKAAGMRAAQGQAQKPQQPGNQPGGADNPKPEDGKKIIEGLADYDKHVFYEPRFVAQRREGFSYKYDAKFDNVPAYIATELLNGQLAQLGIQEKDIKNAKLVDLHDKKTQDDIAAKSRQGTLVKVFDGNDGFQTLRALRKEGVLPSLWGNGDKEVKNVFLNFISVPAYDPDHNTYTDVYFKGTGLKENLEQMGVPPAKIEELAQGYKTLDDRNKEMKERLNALFDKNPGLKKLADKIEVYYAVGKDGDKIVLFSKNSHPYAANDYAPKGKDYDTDKNDIFVRRTEEEFRRDINNPEVITTVLALTEDGQDIIINGKTIHGTPVETFSSPAPKDLAARQRATGKAIFKAVEERDARIIEEARKAAAEAKARREKAEQENKEKLKQTTGVLKNEVNNMNVPQQYIPYNIPGLPPVQPPAGPLVLPPEGE